MNNNEWQRQLNLLMRPSRQVTQPNAHNATEQPQNFNGWLPGNNTQVNIELNTDQIIEWFAGRAFTEPSEREAVLRIRIDGTILESSPNDIINRLNEFPNLEQLQISRTTQVHIPNSIGNLQNLQILDLSNNTIRSLSNRIGNLRNLQGLYLNNNQIEELPETIGNLTRLTDLDISDNLIEFLPQSITNLSSLITFTYNGNPFSEQEETENNTEELLWDRQPEGVRNFLERFQSPFEIREGDIRDEELLAALGINGALYGQQNPNTTGNQELPAGIAFEVHKAFNKIDKAALIEFVKPYINEANVLTYKSKNNNEFKEYLKSSLNGFISKINNNSRKNQAKTDLEKIFTQILGNLQYKDSYKELITYCLEYVKKQPKKFQETYVSTFTYDCAHAYDAANDDDNSSISCAKGMLERFVLNLKDAAVAVKSTNNAVFNTNKYAELISIIQSVPLSNSEKITKDINKYAQECLGNNSVNSNEKLIECVKQKFGERLTDSISSQIETYIPTLRLYGGKRRKPIKTRKARKNKRRTLAKHKKSLRKILKHKSKKHIRR
jgi:Leucine-rich repeat (LRR) protein